MLATTVKPAKADYYWQTNVKNKLPRAAISAGSISDSPYPVYICRAKTNGNLHPGKLAYYNNRWSCFIGNGGVEERYETYDVLIAYGTTAFSWEYAVGDVPAYTMPGGQISDTPYTVYVCDVNLDGNDHPGKLAYYDDRWSCFIGNGGEEQRYDEYYALVLTAP
jgi:hypothetical protein